MVFGVMDLNLLVVLGRALDPFTWNRARFVVVVVLCSSCHNAIGIFTVRAGLLSFCLLTCLFCRLAPRVLMTSCFACCCCSGNRRDRSCCCRALALWLVHGIVVCILFIVCAAFPCSEWKSRPMHGNWHGKQTLKSLKSHRHSS